jgi:hypothetical protein
MEMEGKPASFFIFYFIIQILATTSCYLIYYNFIN